MRNCLRVVLSPGGGYLMHPPRLKLTLACVALVSAFLFAATTSAAQPPPGQKAEKKGLQRPDLLSLARATAALGSPYPQGQWALLLAGEELVRQKIAGEERFWLDGRRRLLAASAQLVGIRDPYTAAAMRIQGGREGIWPLFLETVPDLNPKSLQGVRDGKPWVDMVVRNPGEEARLHLRPGYREYLVYADALFYASRTPADVFAKAAADNTHVKFAHINSEPWKYRGQVIHLAGTLRRLNRHDAPVPAIKHGVPHFYEAWISLDNRGPLIRVDFTELPEGLQVGDDLDRRVSFDGYFFKKWPYTSQDEKERQALFFIAPTLTLQSPRPRPELETGMTKTMVMGIIGCVVLTLGLIIALSLWYKRGDRAVRARLTELHTAKLFDEQAFLGGGPEPDHREPGPPSA